MKRYRHHAYKWHKPFTSAKHQWSFIGPKGGLNFWALMSFKISKDNWAPDSAGLEIHYSRGHQPDTDRAPDHTNCWLTEEPCWHDGTSLYATETLWPMIKPMVKYGDHETIFRLLEGEADRYFGHGARSEEPAQ